MQIGVITITIWKMWEDSRIVVPQTASLMKNVNFDWLQVFVYLILSSIIQQFAFVMKKLLLPFHRGIHPNWLW